MQRLVPNYSVFLLREEPESGMYWLWFCKGAPPVANTANPRELKVEWVLPEANKSTAFNLVQYLQMGWCDKRIAGTQWFRVTHAEIDRMYHMALTQQKQIYT